MHRSNYRRSIWASPCWFGQFICFFCILAKQMFNWTWDLFHAPRYIVKVHFIVLVAHLVRHTACPSLDFVECELLFVITRFTHVNLLIRRKSPGTTFVEACHKHDKAAVQDLFNLVIAVLSSFDHLMFIEMLFITMYSLFWSVVPAGIDPSVTSTILPGSIDLGYSRLCQVIGIFNVNPVPCSLLVVYTTQKC